MLEPGKDPESKPRLILGGAVIVLLILALIVWQNSQGHYISAFSFRDLFRLEFSPRSADAGRERTTPAPSPPVGQPAPPQQPVPLAPPRPAAFTPADLAGVWRAETPYGPVRTMTSTVEPGGSYVSHWQYADGSVSQARGTFIANWTQPNRAVFLVTPRSCLTPYCPPEQLQPVVYSGTFPDRDTMLIESGAGQGLTARRVGP